MRESIKAVLQFILIVSGLVILISFIPDFRNTPWRWMLPLFGVTVALIDSLVLLLMHFQRDLAKDFLYMPSQKYFDCHGFCFRFIPQFEQNVCVIHVLFQNRFDRPSEGHVILRAEHRHDIQLINLQISCPAAGYGIARIPCCVPAKYQGSTQVYEVFASACYPHGKGRRLRFRPALQVGSLSSSFSSALTVAGALAGAIVTTRPAQLVMTLPKGLAESFDAPHLPAIEVLWRLGDPIDESAVYKREGA